MTDFPAQDAPLTQDTFNTAYNVIKQQIEQETPSPLVQGTAAVPNDFHEQWAASASKPLDKWRVYTNDGDLSKLPTAGGAATPWEYLQQTSMPHLFHDQSQVQTIHDTLVHNWTGTAGYQYVVYLQDMQKRLDNYSKDKGNLDSLAEMLKAAFAVEAAFKKDLLESARAVSKALDNVEHGGGSVDVGLLTLAVVALGIGGLGAVAAATGVAGAVFVNATVGALVGGAGLKTITDHVVTIGGGGIDHVMDSFGSAVDTIVTNYRQAANDLANKMDNLSDELKGETAGIKAEKDVPDVTDPSSTFKLSDFLPGSAAGSQPLVDKINNPPK
jgi:hypothetical protein